MRKKKVKVPQLYYNAAFRAKTTGADIRLPLPTCITSEVRKQRFIYKHRAIFQMLILGEKYCTIADKVKLKEGHIAMIVARYQPHLLRGRGKRNKHNVEPQIEEIEKIWNLKTLKYELPSKLSGKQK